MINLTIYTNATAYPYEKNFQETTTLGEFKKRMILIAGIEQLTNMTVEIVDKDMVPIEVISDDSKTLGDYGLKENSIILVKDITDSNKHFVNTDNEERYVMPDDKYDEREDSARVWKKKILASEDTEEKTNLKLGDHVAVFGKEGERIGEVAFVGKTEFAEGLWIGVILKTPIGKNDGTVNGKRYFECEPNFGIFAKAKCVEHLAPVEQAPEEF
uniref:CAP-Gly domain-containing protein n=1 Tax=Rhabditophanes sp. KR3021 TaxID=114890 RepID=A0AC35UD94_9BILA